MCIPHTSNGVYNINILRTIVMVIILIITHTHTHIRRNNEKKVVTGG